MFGRATIRLGIGPHSSFYWIFIVYMRTLAVVNLDDAERFKTKVDTCTMFASFSCSSDFNEHTKVILYLQSLQCNSKKQISSFSNQLFQRLDI